MENQGNMQSGKKAAVIYFLAAFFIACIGIAGANYLKGELGLSAEELVKKVELTVEIAVLLGIAIAVRHLLKKRNRKIAGIIVFLFVAGFFSWQNSGIWQESQLKPQRLETPESEFDRYDIKDGHFTVAEANANIVKEINVDYLDNVTVHFSKPVTQKVIVRVLYETKTQHGFDNKTRKMRVKVHKGETVGCVSMKVKDVTRIKIGIGRKIGTQFDYGYTEINGNYAARMHQKKVSMVEYFVFFMLIPAGYFILAAGKKWQEKTDFYEKYYVNPAKTKLDFPSQKRNLIYIFMESMESSYADQEDGGIMDDNYIPNLTKLAKENINFSDKADGKLGGPTCLEATAYTVGGMVAQTAAINLKLHNSGSMFGNFLPNLTTMGDILNKEGYQQVFLCGSEGDFAGRDTYFTSHKDFHIEDYNAAKKEGFIAPDYKVFWGHEDEILYKRAKKQLEQLSSSDKPFNLTMLTVDTHFPRGYKCRLCKDKYNRQYANVIACADQQVYDFVEWIKKQDFYKNTTIVIAGDHTTMVDTSDPIWGNLNNNYKRTVYNTIINADCTYKENVTENRDFSTMDMFPTTLAALGVQIDGNRLGLGTNLFSGQKTLPEKLGRGYINQELKKNDKEYNGFY